jgi:uncharacterized protein YegP (UPF0339 family)
MHFVVKKSGNNEFRFNMVANNGRVVATSETYQRKQAALDTIEAIRHDAGAARVEDETAVPAG